MQAWVGVHMQSLMAGPQYPEVHNPPLRWHRRADGSITARVSPTVAIHTGPKRSQDCCLCSRKSPWLCARDDPTEIFERNHQLPEPHPRGRGVTLWGVLRTRTVQSDTKPKLLGSRLSLLMPDARRRSIPCVGIPTRGTGTDRRSDAGSVDSNSMPTSMPLET